MNQPLLLTIAAIVLLAGGIAIGYVFGRSRGNRQSVERANRVQEEYDAYRSRVTEHFRETAGQFQAIGEQYRDLYRHLASGAETLCETSGEAGRLEFRPPPELVHDTAGGSGRRPSQKEEPAFTRPTQTGPVDTRESDARVTAAGEMPPPETDAAPGEREVQAPDPAAMPEKGRRATAAGELPAGEPDKDRTGDGGESGEGARAGATDPSADEPPAEADEPKPSATATGGRS